jgi:hypothetical protein
MFRGALLGVSIGLWQICGAHSTSETACVAIRCGDDPYGRGDLSTGDCTKLWVAIGFITLACIMSAIATLCLFIYARKNANPDNRLLARGKVCLFVCLITGVVGVAIGINTLTYGSLLPIGAAANLGITAIVFSFADAVLSVVIGRHAQQAYNAYS